MPEAHDVPGTRAFISSMRYPKRDWGFNPFFERGATAKEYEEPFRIGQGFTLRVPFTRWALLLGRWLDDGGDEDERLRAMLGADDSAYETTDIRSW